MKLGSICLPACIFALSGCADHFLQREIRGVEARYGSLSSPNDMRGRGNVPNRGVGENVEITVNFAFEMADAYADAARTTMISQDLSSAVILASAAWAGAAALEGQGREIIAERVLPGVAAQTIASRGVGRPAVQALYRGAMQHNCVAMVGSLYTPVAPDSNIPDNAIDQRFASFVMVLVMREIEYRTFQGRARELADFSTLTSAFTAAIEATTTIQPGNPDAETPDSGRTIAQLGTDADGQSGALRIQRNPALERFFLALSGCLATAENAQPAPNLAATAPT